MVDLTRARTIIQIFGYYVRVNRLARGLSQQQLAVRAHVRKKFIGEIERGETNPSLESMVLVADALGCTIADLIPSDETTSSMQFARDDLRRARHAVGVLSAIFKPEMQRLGRLGRRR